LTQLQIPTPRVFVPLLQPARYKGAWGGRASGKSHFFAELLIETCCSKPVRAVCIREVQKSIKESVKRLIEDKIISMGVSNQFEVLEAEIRVIAGAGKGGHIVFTGMQNHTAQSIKSLEGYDIAWVEEAQTMSAYSLKLLRPTIRKEDDSGEAEMWFSWNPEDSNGAVDQLLRGKNKIVDAIVVEASYLDNPFCPKSMVKEAEEEKAKDLDEYLHIWMGQYKRVLEGAVYANEIRAVFSSKRVMKVLPMPGKPIETFWDLGKRDHTSIWFAQMQMGEYRILDFYENRGHFLDHYVKALKDKNYQYGTFYLPHDADSEKLNAKSIADDLRIMMPGHIVKVIPRMSNKALGINAARKIFPNCYFDEEKTADGLKRLGAFKYKVDPETNSYSAQPDHDENSDAADAFAQLALSLTDGTKPKVKSVMIA
jgi:phage terminase large subunit